MKKFLLYINLVLFTFATTISVYAQCVPDQSITQPGIYPDSLPAANVGTAYSQELQIRVLTDTVYQGQNATIQSIHISSISGMPSGFSYVCVPSNCTFPGGSNGCIVISGLAVAGQEGSYPLSITLDITATVIILGFPATITQTETMNDYTFVINGPVATHQISAKNVDIKQNFPNPAIDKTTIDFIVPNTTAAEFTLFNVLGKEILKRRISAKQGKNTIELNVRDYEDGIYMYSIKTGSTVVTRRMVINKKQ